MILEMQIPSPGESISEVEIAQWLVADGEYVEKDQIIAEIDSDKATLELPAEQAGSITLKAEEGDVVQVGQVVCHIDTSAESNSKDKPSKNEKAPQEKAEVEIEVDNSKSDLLSPAARKIADEKNINVNEIKGTGKGGRITKQDVLLGKPAMGNVTNSNRAENRSKLSMLRRKVAERLVSVKNETAMLTTFNEVDMSAIFELRKKYKEKFKEKHALTLDLCPFSPLLAFELFKNFQLSTQ